MQLAGQVLKAHRRLTLTPLKETHGLKSDTRLDCLEPLIVGVAGSEEAMSLLACLFEAIQVALTEFL